MFEKFTFWLNTDSNSKKKILLIIVGTLILGGLSVGLYRLNTQKAKQNQEVNPVAITTSQDVNQPIFDSSSGLKQISNVSLGLPQRVGFNPINNIPFYVDSEYKLVLNNVPNPQSPIFLPKTYSLLKKTFW